MILTLLIVYLHQSVHDYSIRNLCNGFHRSGILISLFRNSSFRITGMMVSTAGTVALNHRNGGSQNPDRWLKRSRNTQLRCNGAGILIWQTLKNFEYTKPREPYIYLGWAVRSVLLNDCSNSTVNITTCIVLNIYSYILFYRMVRFTIIISISKVFQAPNKPIGIFLQFK